MTTEHPLEAYDLLRFSETFVERLAAAQQELGSKRGHAREKAWLSSALEQMEEAAATAPSLLERVRALPDLDAIREELAGGLQSEWVDALEKLVAGIAFHENSRSPVIEALFPHQKFAALRRATRKEVRGYASDFARRLKSSYVTRMLAQPTFSFAQGVLDRIADAYGRWEQAFAQTGLSAAEQRALRDELSSAAGAMELAVRQARLVAEAALLPFEGMFEGHSLNAKPKKRSSRQLTPTEAAPEPEPPSAEPVEAASEDSAEAKPKKSARRKADALPEADAPSA
jgi:hypothetical protein